MPLNPLDWTAEPFLTLYVAVALIALGLCLRMRSRIGSQSVPPISLTAPQLAYMAGGACRAGDAILVELFEAKQATLSEDGKYINVDPRAALLRARPDQSGLIEPKPMTRLQFQSMLAPYLEEIQGLLTQAGLIPTAEQSWSYRGDVLLTLLVPILLGIEKIEVGIGRGKPVGYLTALVIVTAVLGLFLMIGLRLTAAGKAILKEYKTSKARLARAPIASELPMAVALSGLAVLAGTELEPIYNTARARDRAGTAGGCGGGGCGGGGCGGGGCGGCGGG
jgi:uncharacterized protein (TIGR04222 family)